jgi:methyltransferase (TIGR00027 family)
MGIISFLVFVVLQIAFLPLAIVGLVLVISRQLIVSKRLGVSQTGIKVLHGRWTMHVFDIRRDWGTARLSHVLPNSSPLGLWLVLAPLWVKYKLSGSYFGYPRIPEEGAETIADIITARTLYFDRIMERVADDMSQFVVLGAGYDARAYGQLKRDGLACYELDQTKTQELKVAALTRAGIEADHVTFVSVDFSREDVFEKLETAGYDSTKKTLFLWEGVTLYLAEEDVRRTMRDIREHSAPGSVVVADLYADRMIQMVSKARAKKALDYTGEGMDFGLPFSGNFEHTLEHFLQSEDMSRGETYFMGRTHKKGPFGVVVEIGV